MVRSSPQQFIEEKKKRHGGLEEGRAGECRLHGKRGRDKKGAESIAKMRRAKGKGARTISGISVLHFQVKFLVNGFSPGGSCRECETLKCLLAESKKHQRKNYYESITSFLLELQPWFQLQGFLHLKAPFVVP